MKNNIDNFLLAALIAVISAGGAALYYISKSAGTELAGTSTSSATSAYKHHPMLPDKNTAAFSPNAIKYQNFAMPEPFAANTPFELTPAAWMQMMSNMMNSMQMTQMMHQMAAMPSQMMNPHGMLPNQALNPSQPLMDPKEYKKWYEQQKKLQQSDK